MTIFKTMTCKMLLFLALALISISCERDKSFVIDLPVEPEAIADHIASSELFKQTASVLKEIHFMMLSNVHDGAETLTFEESERFTSSKEEIEAFLKAKKYKNAAELADLTVRSNNLRKQMLAELTAIKLEIGEEKFGQVDEFINSKYGHMYKVSADEALTLIK